MIQTTPTRDEAVLRDVLAQTERRENGLRANMDEVATLAHQMIAIIRRGALRPGPQTGWLEPASAPAPASGRVDAVAELDAFYQGWLSRWRDQLASLSPAATPVSESEPVREAAQALIAARSSTYKARNGRVMGIEDDSGEMMWIVPFDEMLALEDALAKPASSPAGGDAAKVLASMAGGKPEDYAGMIKPDIFPSADEAARILRDRDACRSNLGDAWAAMRMIREAVETLGPIGAMPAEEHLAGPTFLHEAEAIVAGIMKMKADQ